VKSTDKGGLSFEKDFTIDVANVNEAPTALTLSNATVAENAAGATVGTLTVTDPDAGDTHAFAVSDSRFEVVGATLKWKGGVSLNFEAEPAVNLSVTATDAGGLSITKPFTINVTNVNEAPTDIALSGNSVAENLPVDTVVGGFSNNDPDAHDTHTYRLVDALPHNANTRPFSLDHSGTLRTPRRFDHEAQHSYALRVRWTDAGGLSTDKEFAIRVVNVNEAPTAIALSGNSVAENQPAGTVVGAFSTTDP